MKELKKTLPRAKSSSYMMTTNVIKKVKIDLYLDKNGPLATSKAKFIFSGLGADEVFGGNNRFKWAQECAGLAGM